MFKKERYIGTGIDQDTSPDKRGKDTFYDSENIRILYNGRNLSIKPIKESGEYTDDFENGGVGIYNIGSIEIKNKLYIFATTNTSTPGTGDHFLIRVNEDGSTDTMYSGSATADWDFSTQYPLELVANYENEDIIKLYWTDGYNLFRFINVALTPSGTPKINIVEEITLSQLEPTLVAGGSLKAGNIQYAYTLYNLNGSESVLSPFSRMMSVSLNMKGYNSNQSTGLSMHLSATIDTDFEYIRVYSIHFLELNQTPVITLVLDEQITSSTFVFIDDGNSVVAELSEAELFSLGGRPFIVGTLAAKRNRLFIANYSINNFDPDIDMRAFGFPISSDIYYVKNSGGSPTAYDTSTVFNMPPETDDCINPDPDTYIYARGTSPGVAGPNISIFIAGIDLSTSTDGFNTPSLKRGEIYRFGIVFFNKYGQKSPVKWISDIKIYHHPFGRHRMMIPYVVLTTAGSAAAIAAGCTNYQLVMVERKVWDRTIIAQGFLVPATQYKVISSGTPLSPYYHPHHAVKDICTESGFSMLNHFQSDVDWDSTSLNAPEITTATLFFYSSDTIFESQLDSATSVVCIGTNYPAASTDNSTEFLYLQDGVKSATYSATYNTLQLTGYPPPASFGATFLFDKDTATHTAITNFFTTFIRNYNTASDGVTPGSTPLVLYEVDLEEPSMFLAKGETKFFTSTLTVSNVVQINNLVGPDEGSFYSKYCGCAVLKFATTAPRWHSLTVLNSWEKFSPHGTDANRRIPIVDLKRTLTNQYGGNTYEVKRRNEYSISGAIRTIDTTPHFEVIGDIYLGPLSVNRADGENTTSIHKNWNIYEHIKVDYIENNHNVFCRRDNMYSWSSGISATTNYRYFRIDDNHALLGAYNQKANFIKNFGKPVNFNSTDIFRNVVQASKEKFPNEMIDSWTKFPVNENRYLEGIYGSITKLYNFKGEIYAFQEKGVCVLSINPRIQTQATDGVNIELGIGAVLYDHRYLNTNNGATNKFAIIDDNKNLFFYDPVFKCITALEDTNLTNSLGVRNIVANLDHGVLKTLFDKFKNEVYFVFNTYSLIYNTDLQKFTSRFIHDTGFDGMYMTFGNKVLYKKLGDEIQQREIAATYKASLITYLFNPEPGFDKIFHNLEFRHYGKDFDQIRVYGQITANVAEVLLSGKIYNKFNIKRIHIPRILEGHTTLATRERYREMYLMVQLSTFAGSTDYNLDDMVIMYNIKG